MAKLPSPSCCTLVPNRLASPAFEFGQESLFDSRARPVPVGDLPHMFMGEVQAAGNGGDDTPDPRGQSKLRLKRYTIHGEIQPRKVRLHKNRVLMSSEKHAFRVTADARQSVGRAFALARKELNLSQDEVGKRFKKSQNAVYNWEAGKVAPPIEAIRWLGREASPATRRALFVAAGIEDDAEGLLSLVADARSIELLANANQIWTPDAKVERSIALPAEWLPEATNSSPSSIPDIQTPKNL